MQIPNRRKPKLKADERHYKFEFVSLADKKVFSGDTIREVFFELQLHHVIALRNSNKPISDVLAIDSANASIEILLACCNTLLSHYTINYSCNIGLDNDEIITRFFVILAENKIGEWRFFNNQLSAFWKWSNALYALRPAKDGSILHQPKNVQKEHNKQVKILAGSNKWFMLTEEERLNTVMHYIDVLKATLENVSQATQQQ